MSDIVSNINRDFVTRLAYEGKRIDGRKFDEFRSISIENGLITSAEGSARVKLGKTDVIAGIKITAGEPFPDTPNSGILTTNAELLPMASPSFESGPPSPESIELARVVDRGIRESNMIDTKALCITPGQKVYVIFVDIHVIDYDGNLFDAASMAAVSALSNTVVPASNYDAGEDFKLPVVEVPVSVTAVKIGDNIMVDPCLDEESIADARLTVTTDSKGSVRAMQKGLAGSFTQEEVENIINTSLLLGQKNRKVIEGD